MTNLRSVILHPAYRSIVVCVVLCGASTTISCTGDTTGPAPIDPARLYNRLSLNQHAITMALTAPYDTLQLTATPQAATGAALADSGVTTWTTTDTSVAVSPTGLLTAVAPTAGATIVASHTIGMVTRTDTAYVNVNDTTSIPRLATLTLHPDTTPFGFPSYDLFRTIHFTTAALDSRGDTIPNVVFRVLTTAPFLVSSTGRWQTQGRIGPYRAAGVGHVLLTTEATVYGVRKVDSLLFTIGWPPHVLVGVHTLTPAGSRTPIGTFVPQDDTVAVGGDVAWENELPGQSIDIVFDDPTAAQAVDSASFLDGFAFIVGLVVPAQGGGNIPAFAPLDTGSLRGQDGLGVRARRFPTAGTYRYHSVLYGTTGVVHVLSGSQVP